MCQHLVEKCITEIYSLKLFGKVLLLTNKISICDVFYTKKSFHALYAQGESRDLTYLCFIVFRFNFLDLI
jgi:hypothetical protein